jgi:hypothetical protein
MSGRPLANSDTSSKAPSASERGGMSSAPAVTGSNRRPSGVNDV